MIYESYDVFPLKGVPFKGSDDISPHLHGHILQRAQFWEHE